MNSKEIHLIIYKLMSRTSHVILVGITPTISIFTLLFGLLKSNGKQTNNLSTGRAAFVYVMTVFMVTLLVSNIIVYLTLLKQKKAIRICTVSQTHSIISTREKLQKVKDNVKSFYTCFGCVFTYVGLWIPSLIIMYISVIEGVLPTSPTFDIACITSASNPLFDAFFLIYFNKDLKSVLGKFSEGS